MRGHALSNTRKLNRHWQSGEGGLVPLGSGPWFNCATYKGHLYQFPLRYAISASSNFPFNRVLKPFDVNNPPNYINPNCYGSSTELYAFNSTYYPFSGVWNYNSSTGHLGEYEIYSNIKLVPGLGNCPCYANINIYCHSQNHQQVVHTIADPYNDKIYTMSLLVDIIFLRTTEDYTTGDTRLRQSLVDERIPESMLTQFLTTPVMVPTGFNPLWQTDDFLNQYFYCVDGRYNPLASSDQVCLLLKRREDDTGDRQGLDEPNFSVYSSNRIIGENGNLQVNPIYQGQVIDVDIEFDYPPTTNPSRAFSGVSYGYSLPYCDGTRHGYIPNYPNDLLAEDAWLRRLQTAVGSDRNVDYEHRNQNWIGYAVILKQIIPEKRTLL